MATLVALPLLAYAVPALLGHPVVPGDDLTQNLPLRELVGRDLRAGHLPVFDPYIWSGAPLLAGWNAGAAYPLTWLFAVVAPIGAWTVNLAAAAAVAGTGCYAFLRASGIGVLAAWLGGLTFAFGGGMVAQVPHLGLLAGMSWVPVALLAILRLTSSRASARARLGWTAALAAAVGMVLLAGEPRAISNAAAVLVVYALWRTIRLARGPGHAGPAVALVVAGVVLGVGLGAVQLIPGLAAVSSSQRADVTATLFSSGSLPVRWLLLLGVPDLLGGSGSFGQPRFFATYNLTEVTGYVGMLPLVAVGALLGRLRRHRPLPEWSVWLVVAVVGVLLALGSNTPLWHLLIRLPLFGGQRLQSRSMLVTDLALAVLLAYFVDGWLREPRRSAAAGGRDEERHGREAALGTVLPAVVIVTVIVALVREATLLEWMGVPADVALHQAALRPWLAPFLLLGALAVGIVWRGAQLSARARGAAVVSFVVVDLLTFVVLTVLAAGAGAAAGSAQFAAAGGAGAGVTLTSASGSAFRPISALHLDGRFAVYDPTLLDETQLSSLGVPDENVDAGTYAVQGYSSLVDRRYAQATGAHRVSGTGQDVLSPRALDDGTLDSLDTAAVLVPGPYLAVRVGGGGPQAMPGGERILAGGHRTTWYLGTPIDVSAVTIAPVRSGSGDGGGAVGLRVGVVTASGATVWATPATPATPASPASPASGPSTTAVLAQPVHAIGVVADALGGSVDVGAPVVRTPRGARYVADGQLQAALSPPHWRYEGTDGSFAVFADRKAARPLTLHALPGRTLGRASVRAVSGPTLAPTRAAVSSAHGAEIVRAVAAMPGWHATWRPAGAGRPVALAVVRHGVVQAVDVPAGSGIVSWQYDAPGLAVGALVSALSVVAVVVLCAAAGLAEPERRRARTDR